MTSRLFVALFLVDTPHRNGYASSKASNLRRARAALSAPGACSCRPSHCVAARRKVEAQEPAWLASPLAEDRQRLGVVVARQERHDRVVLLQARAAIHHHRLVPPAVLGPGQVVGVLAVVLQRKASVRTGTRGLGVKDGDDQLPS